jgi:peptidoglycan lytic transglycosylase
VVIKFPTRIAPRVLFALLLLARMSPAQDVVELAPTVHPALPSNASDLWLVPSGTDRAARTLATYQPLVAGVARFQVGDYTGAVTLLSRPALRATTLEDYATYYIGLAQLRLGQHADARRTFEGIINRNPSGNVAVAAALGAGEAAEAAGDFGAAVKIYERLVDHKGAIKEEVLVHLGRAALASGDRKKAAEAFVRVYYEFPLTDAAAMAAPQIQGLQDQITRNSYKLDMGRAQLLFGARRYTEARAAFQSLQPVVDGDDKELAALRVAECDFSLKQYAAARDGVRPYLEHASRNAEARFFYLSSLRELGDPQFIALTEALVADFPDSSWSEEALNNLATHYIVTNEDALATKAFREMYEKFPTGQHAERAAWKYGWASYKNGDYAEAVRVFEAAALAFPRSDYRPPYLYWAARAHYKLDAAAQADARLRLVYTDYANSYYGRLAERQLSLRGGLASAAGVRLAMHETPAPAAAPAPPPIPTDAVIRLLLANGLYDDALGELRFAQRAWGNSPRIDATIAWTYHEKGDLRRAITLMRRAYPQHLTAGGQLPAEILQVIYPLTYWDSIRKYSATYGLDPYLVAALIAQESTFDPGIKSVANAWGLMQLVPATGRQLAKAVGVRKFTTTSLTNPEINIRLGTLYFSRLVQQFGGTYYALASYNAGESRIVRWKSERPGMEEDEFIDDIPFPETQNYVKRILGTAEDYRLLYGSGAGTPRPAASSPALTSKTSAKPAAKKAPAKKKKTPARRPSRKPRHRAEA